MEENPYINPSGPPGNAVFICLLCRYFRLWASQLREAIRAGKGADFLVALRHALSSAYEHVREHSKDLGDESFFMLPKFLLITL